MHLTDKKEVNILTVGSETGKTTTHILHEIIAEHNCAVIVLEDNKPEPIKEEVFKIQAHPSFQPLFIDMNPRGVIPPKYYKT